MQMCGKNSRSNKDVSNLNHEMIVAEGITIWRDSVTDHDVTHYEPGEYVPRMEDSKPPCEYKDVRICVRVGTTARPQPFCFFNNTAHLVLEFLKAPKRYVTK